MNRVYLFTLAITLFSISISKSETKFLFEEVYIDNVTGDDKNSILIAYILS